MSANSGQVSAVPVSSDQTDNGGRAPATGSWRSDGPRVLDTLAQLREEVAAVHAALARLERAGGENRGDRCGDEDRQAGIGRSRASGEWLDGRIRAAVAGGAARLVSGALLMASRCGDGWRVVKARRQQRASAAPPGRAGDPSRSETEQQASGFAADWPGAAGRAGHLWRRRPGGAPEPRRRRGVGRPRAQTDSEDEATLRGLRAIYPGY